MIFVTVGTHEQPFDRLVEAIDALKKEGRIDEDVVIQTGFSVCVPQCCRWEKFFPYTEMLRLVHEARIVITHGGPSSFIMPLQESKIPVVVPRQKQFNEHVNDHQLEFAKTVQECLGNIIVVDDIADLGGIIENYDALTAQMNASHSSNNQSFCDALSRNVAELMKR